MIKLLGNLPEEWWSDWEAGRRWYKTESKDGGELAEIILGTLYHQITEIGTHDGAYQAGNSSHKDESLGHDSADDSGKKHASMEDGTNSTSRLIALVGELTTSQAADVIARANNSTSSSANEDKSKSSSALSNAKRML
jgi:serine/threonine-protein kinase SRPK3